MLTFVHLDMLVFRFTPLTLRVSLSVLKWCRTLCPWCSKRRKHMKKRNQERMCQCKWKSWLQPLKVQNWGPLMFSYPLFLCVYINVSMCPCLLLHLDVNKEGMLGTTSRPIAQPSSACLRPVLTHSYPWPGSSHIDSQLAWSVRSNSTPVCGWGLTL